MSESDSDRDDRANDGAGRDQPEADSEHREDDEVRVPDHLDDQLGDEGDDSGVEEALQAWAEGGHAPADVDEGDEIKLVHLPQLEPGLPQAQPRPGRLNNVYVTTTVELGRRSMTVRDICDLKETEVIELDKLAGESFEVRVNGRLFAFGEVVVVTDMMAVRITSLVDSASGREPAND